MADKSVRKRKYVRVIFFIALMAIFFVASVYLYNRRISYKGFLEADKKKGIFIGQLKGSISGFMNQEDKKVCYNSEQGPFDNGKLWCQVDSALYSADGLDKVSLLTKSKSIIHNQGWELSDKRAGDLVIKINDNIFCSLTIYDGYMAKKPGNYLSGSTEANTTIVIDCSGRSVAKFYPYVGW